MHRSTGVVIFSLFLGALPAMAQPAYFGPERATGFFGLGFSAPVNPLANRLDAGWNVAGGVGVTGQYAGLMVDLMYNSFGINSKNLGLAQATDGSQRYWAITIDPVFHVNQRGPVDFYVTGGAGLYGQITRYELNSNVAGGFGQYNLVSSNTIYKGGVDGGAGFAFNIGYSPVKLFVEARFHHVFTGGPGASFVPVTVGVSF